MTINKRKKHVFICKPKDVSFVHLILKSFILCAGVVIHSPDFGPGNVNPVAEVAGAREKSVYTILARI